MKFADLNTEDVIEWIFLPNAQLMKAGRLESFLHNTLTSTLPSAFLEFLGLDERSRSKTLYQIQLKDGVDCKILRADVLGWQKGKVRFNISIEFVPEEISEESIQTTDRSFNTINYADSSLDEIRKMKTEE